MELSLTAICRTGRARIALRDTRTHISYSNPIATVVAAIVLVILISAFVWILLDVREPLDRSNLTPVLVISTGAAAFMWVLLRRRDRLIIDRVDGTAELRKYRGVLSETTILDARRLEVVLRPISIHQPRWPSWTGYAVALCEGKKPVMVLSIRRTLAECRRDCAAFPESLTNGLVERTGTIHAASAY